MCGYALSESPYGLVWRHGSRPFGTLGSARQHPVLGEVNRARVRHGGHDVGPGEVGELELRNPTLMRGYYEMPEETAAVLRDGWLDSGDLAHADEDGYLWFFGRKKQIIVHDGSNISPMEVEDALAEHPAVALVGVVGIHDGVHGENVRAYVTIQDDVPRPSAQELIDFARAHVGYKAPEEVVFLDEMPVNATGKIDRVELKRIAEDHLHPHGLPA